jgi:23S rRNA (pseudouridine1915-N3)-methyltransferase
MITVLAVGSVKDKNISCLIAEYMKRMRRVEIKIVKEEKNQNQEIVKNKESERLLASVKDSFVVALSEEGRTMNSYAFAEFIKKQQNMTFLIGGAFGLSDDVKKKSNCVLSLSPLTFPHEIAQLLLVEQMYRAQSIIEGKKYQK